ncbi:MAG: protein of unknown function DUF881 [uncultured bacterium]|nr:MAG: protein of unknown function DUF881 [uncultured bacterium]
MKEYSAQNKGNGRENFVFSLILLLMGMIVGVFIAVQIRTTKSIARSADPVRPTLELEDTVEEMRDEQKDLKDEISVLRKDVKNKEKEFGNRKAASKEITAELKEYKKIVGLTFLEGKGVEVTLGDGNYDGLKDRNDFKNDAIIHSTDILDVINGLWFAGAEAISVNEERITSVTSVNCIVNTILINESHVGAPLKISAIGDPKKLKSSIEDRKRLIDLHERAEKYGIVLEVAERDSVKVNGFSGGYE